MPRAGDGEVRQVGGARWRDQPNRRRAFQHLQGRGGARFFGSPDEIAAKLDVLRAAGVRYVLLNGPQGSRENLRRFAREVMAGVGGEERKAAE